MAGEAGTVRIGEAKTLFTRANSPVALVRDLQHGHEMLRRDAASS